MMMRLVRTGTYMNITGMYADGESRGGKGEITPFYYRLCCLCGASRVALRNPNLPVSLQSKGPLTTWVNCSTRRSVLWFLFSIPSVWGDRQNSNERRPYPFQHMTLRSWGTCSLLVEQSYRSVHQSLRG